MKKSRSVAKSTAPARLYEEVNPSAEQENRMLDKSNLSPERIMDGASEDSALINQILAQRQRFHQIRDWGINE